MSLTEDEETVMQGIFTAMAENEAKLKDIDTENVELASNQIRYQGLTDSITKQFQGLQSVMK